MRHRERMSNQSAVCIRCGQFKPRALGTCGACGFAPSCAEDEARSLMLSPCFDAGELLIGLPATELQHAANLIQSGGHYVFEPNVLSNVLAIHTAARSLTPRRLVTDFVYWLLPPLLLLVALFWIIARK
jgi:hypothetical protein